MQKFINRDAGPHPVGVWDIVSLVTKALIAVFALTQSLSQRESRFALLTGFAKGGLRRDFGLGMRVGYYWGTQALTQSLSQRERESLLTARGGGGETSFCVV